MPPFGHVLDKENILSPTSTKRNKSRAPCFVLFSLRIGFATCLLLILPNMGFSQKPTAEEAARIKKLENSLLAPCCYSEPVARHMSEISFQMRKEIQDKVMAGQSDREILDYYKQLYGEQVLMEPEGTKRIVLYSMPVLISLTGLAMVLLFLRHALRRSLPRGQATTRIKVDNRFTEAIRNGTDEL